MNRRTFLKTGLTGTATVAGASLAGASYLTPLQPTPTEIKGPFYPVQAQKDQDFDLTRIDGNSGTASGDPIFIEGMVVDTDSKPLADVTVDLWQANAVGRYRHPHDPNSAPLDPNFQGWAIVPSGKEGQFRFKTVMPGSYPASADWIRPPHIHFKVSKRGYVELITQMYFPDHELNKKDLLLQRKGKEDQELMVATLIKKEPATYQFKIILQPA
jgi:protocatechuate 3,4-dioxygenase beta subunit